MTTPDVTPRVMTIRTPEDLIAATWVSLGFQPEDSVVMLTIGGSHPLQARVDLPDGDHQIDDVVESLAGPAVRQQVAAAAFLLYTSDDPLARRVVGRLRRRLRGSSVRVLDALRVDGGRWYPLPRDGGRSGRHGTSYDVSSHPFVATAVMDGRVLHGTRAELAATLQPDATRTAEVEAARTGDVRSADWIDQQLAGHTAAGTVPDPADAAALLESVAVPTIRDHAWIRLRRAEARRDVRLWTDLVQRAPDDLVSHAAAVLAFAAWVAGDGALAWCAVDRALEAEPGHSLAGLVTWLLEGAVPPSEWERTGRRFAS